MEGRLDFKKFKNLDELVTEDYLNGTSNHSYSIIADTAGFLTENSITVRMGPFDDVLLAKKETIEKKSAGILDFLSSFKYSSLIQLNNLIPNKLYIFDEDEYGVYSIKHEYDSNGFLYSLKKRDLKNEEITALEKLTDEDEAAKEKRKNSARDIYKLAKFNSLMYEIKSNSRIISNYEDGENNLMLLYVLDSEKKLNGKSILEFDTKKMGKIYSTLKGSRLFVKNGEDELYSLELENNKPYFKKHEAKNDKESIIISLINQKACDGMYD